MIKTIRDLASEYPGIMLHNYKWSDEDNPVRLIDEVIDECGFTFKHIDDEDIIGEYNDIKAYYDIEIIPV